MPQHGNPTGRADANSRVPRASKPPAFPEKEMRAAKRIKQARTPAQETSSIIDIPSIQHSSSIIHHPSSIIQHPASSQHSAFSIQH
jgi:hypothetical protein